MSPFFYIFGKEIPFYGLFFMGGLLLSGVMAVLLAKRKKLPKIELVYSACFAAIGGLIGAKLLSVLTSLSYIKEYKPPLTEIIKNGFVFYGGLIGGAAGLYVYVKAFRCKNALDYFDIFAVCMPFGHAVGRIGCFTSGCCFGVGYDGLFSVIYTRAADLNTPLNVPLLPVQLIESACLLILFAFLITAFFKTERQGLCTVTYLFVYASMRFVLEYFRGDYARGFISVFSTSQVISLIILAGLTAYFAVRWIRIAVLMKRLIDKNK